jgi:SAM-dependent methyltransferase
MKKISYHPACLLFPKLPRDELKALAADIKANGLRNPVVRYHGQILDGRNRLAACKIAKVKPRFVEWDGQGSPLQWVISENLIRRHLTASQRAVIAFDLLPLLEDEAKTRQRLSQGRGKKGAKSSATFSGDGKASEVAARIARTNATYVEAAKAISKAAPELVKKVRAGDLSIPDAKRLADIPKEQRAELLQAVNGKSHNGEILNSWRHNCTPRPLKTVPRGRSERRARIDAATLMHGDCRKELKKIASHSVDAIISDPIYPEVNRQYGRVGEDQWHDMMRDVVGECRRVLKPKGSAVFIMQPNYNRIGQMRLWVWEFVAWAGKEWNVVQDVWWWNVNTLPTRSTYRTVGLLRQSVKMCVWLGEPDCYRNQNAVLWEPSDATKSLSWSDRCLRNFPSGHTVRRARIAQAASERDGTTPFNLLPVAAANPTEHCGHPASTPYELAAWWCRYILPPGGIVLDPFCGSGTMLLAGLDHGASKVIGIDREKKYLAIAKRRIKTG